ncbi:MAG TPA: UvrB/UvrC motif-containing protein [Chthoniobacterales bacterium]
MQKLNLCEACSKKNGVTDPTGFALADLLLGLGTTQNVEISTPGETADGQCPTCGFTQADFKKTGRLGCSDCYETFATQLQPLLAGMHKGTRHVGKIPSRQFREVEISNRLTDLRNTLQKSVEEEDYELAAKLRDEIRQLQQLPAPNESLS